MHFPTSTPLAALALALFTSGSSAQQSSATSSFNWDSLISAAGTSLTSFDLYTTNGSLGPGELDTSSRAGLYSSVMPTPVVGPIGNGTVANGTASNGTMTMGGGGGSGGGAMGSESSASAGVPQATGNAAAGGSGGLWVEGAGVLVGLGVVMAAL